LRVEDHEGSDGPSTSFDLVITKKVVRRNNTFELFLRLQLVSSLKLAPDQFARLSKPRDSSGFRRHFHRAAFSRGSSHPAFAIPKPLANLAGG
jgi:hypothetical protein